MQLSYFSNGEIFHQSMSVYQTLNERMPFNSSNKTRLEICIIYEPEALYSSLEKHPVETRVVNVVIWEAGGMMFKLSLHSIFMQPSMWNYIGASYSFCFES